MTASAVATREESTSVVAMPRPAISLLRPIAEPSAVLQSQEETRTMVTQILQTGRDFGVIPGTDKPTMLKPGAERVALAFGCYYGEPVIVEREVDHDRIVEYSKRKKVWRNQFAGDREFTWEEVHGTSRGLYRYVVRVDVINRATGQVVGSAVGSCSTMESKYIDRPRDSENTALKMAHKRAMVGSCLITFGLSDQFTQDVEDIPKEALHGEGAPELPAMDPECPKCKGKMWDNRLSKKSAKQPDFKCKDKQCDGVIWPPRDGEQKATPAKAASRSTAPAQDDDHVDFSVESRADGDGVSTDPDDVQEMTLEAALAMKLPGSSTAWGGKGGTALGQLSVKMLQSVAKWCLGKITEAGHTLTSPDADQQKVELVKAIELVLELKGAGEEGKDAKAQQDLGLTGNPVKDAATQQAAQEGEKRPDPTSSGSPRKPSAKQPKDGPPTTSSKPTAAIEGPSMVELWQQLQQLLMDADRTEDERADIRKRMNAAKTVEQLQALVTDLSMPV